MKILFTLLLLCNLLVGCGYQRGVIESDDTFVVDAIVLVEGEDPWAVPFTAKDNTQTILRIQISTYRGLNAGNELSLYVDTVDGQSMTIFRDYPVSSGHHIQGQLGKGQLLYVSVIVPVGRTTIRLVEGKTNQLCEFQTDARDSEMTLVHFTLDAKYLSALELS